MPIFLVVYRDDEGPYAQAFSTRAGAEAFIASFSRPADFTLVCTAVDQSLALVADEETP
jgi:alkyl hydroperoxide reductase subunit AhpC